MHASSRARSGSRPARRCWSRRRSSPARATRWPSSGAPCPGSGSRRIRLRRAERPGDPGRPVRRPQPALRQALHAGPRPDGPVRRLLVRGRPHRARARAPREPRRVLRRRRARADRRDRGLRKRMGWRFTWVSSFGSDFNYDFNVSFTPEEIAAGRAFYNYRAAVAAARGRLGRQRVLQGRGRRDLPHLFDLRPRRRGVAGRLHVLDMTPKGRDENGPYNSLADWVRPRNMYGKGGSVEGNGRFHPEGCGCTAHGRG